ncbi:MAG: M15 family metallopeptidase [Candidatus Magasanikbacteria bacterium]
MTKNKNIIKIFFAIIFALVFLPNSAMAAKSKIGDPCVSDILNTDCEYGGANLDCEETTLTKDGKNQYFCTCYKDEDCTTEYGTPKDGGDWKCEKSPFKSFDYNLHYCRSTKMLLGNGEFVKDPLTIEEFYCLTYNKTNQAFSCTPVPVEKGGGCSATINKFFLNKAGVTNFGDSSTLTSEKCETKKTTVSTGQFCKVDDKCISNKIDDCGSNTLYKTYDECIKNIKTKTCTQQSDCSSGEIIITSICVNKICYPKETLTIIGECKSDSDCQASGKAGACFLDGSYHLCAYKDSDNVTSFADMMNCGSTTCTKSDKKCQVDNDCSGLDGIGICKDNYCWLDEASMKKYKSSISFFGVTADLQIRKPVLEINIPQLKFSDVENSVDDEGFLHLPYIGEYMSAIYKVAMVAISIIGVIMIIVVGVKITVMGGEERVNGFKKIGQIVVGLLIAWGSYTILYTINPDLVNFQALKVQYIEQQDLPDDVDTSDMEAGMAGMAGGVVEGEKGACDKINPAAPPSNWVDMVAACKNNKCPGLSVVAKKDLRENFVLKITADKLMNAGKKAAAQGYVISVRSKCRSIASQKALADKEPGGVKSGSVAKPGNSPHGTGYAVDLVLMKDGKVFSDGAFSASKQCNANLQGVSALSAIMYSAGFVRYGAENWHFEAQKAGNYCRITGYTGLSPCIPPAKGAERCPVK